MKNLRRIKAAYKALSVQYAKLNEERTRLWDIEGDPDLIDDLDYTLGKIADALDGIWHHLPNSFTEKYDGAKQKDRKSFGVKKVSYGKRA